MRQFATEFADHLASGATTLCWCWKIVRRDGAVLGFTDHDVALEFDGTRFDPASGLDGSEATDRLGAQVQTSDVVGVLTSDAISEADIVLGRYDGAKVESWRVNWRDVVMREQIRVDTIGEITREDGVFRAELRSPQHALNVPKGRIYHHLCDARLGDGRCGVDLEQGAYRASGVVVSSDDATTVSVSGLDGFDDGWFARGIVVWNSGTRIGIRDAVAGHTGGRLTFEKKAGEWVAAGDAFTVYAGCDKSFATCREKFGNGVNFQGFPHIPGSDFVMRYPNDDDRLDGGLFVR